MKTSRRLAVQLLAIGLVALPLSGCSYNKFVTQEEAVKAQWAQVQNQLQRRNDLIPNLVETVKGYASQEKSVIQAVADSRAKLAGAIGIGIENYQALPIKKQPPMIVADYRRQTKSAPAEPIAQEGSVKEADASLLELVGRSAFLPPQQASTPSKKSSLDSAPIIP